jgi:hypothetical protein
MADLPLFSFTAMLNKQVGSATIFSSGIEFRATGGVSSVITLASATIVKFQVTPDSNPKAILKFELNTGSPPAQLQVVLTEDERCGKSDADQKTHARVVLEQARAIVVGQRQWPCNLGTQKPASAVVSLSSSSPGTKDKEKDKARPAPGPEPTTWGRMGGNSGGRLGGDKAKEPPAKKKKVNAESLKAIGAARVWLVENDVTIGQQFRELVLELQVRFGCPCCRGFASCGLLRPVAVAALSPALTAVSLLGTEGR